MLKARLVQASGIQVQSNEVRSKFRSKSEQVLDDGLMKTLSSISLKQENIKTNLVQVLAIRSNFPGGV